MAKEVGINKKINWTWCDQTNTTYFDCPIANYDRKRSFIVAVHNPALQPKYVSWIKTSHRNYSV